MAIALPALPLARAAAWPRPSALRAPPRPTPSGELWVDVVARAPEAAPGTRRDKRAPHPGLGVAGVVRALDGACGGLAVGDAVWGVVEPGRPRHGATLSLRAARVARKPRTLAFAEAAAVVTDAATAWLMLFRHGRAERGERIAVLGAETPVGALAVRLAHAEGLDVHPVAVRAPDFADACRRACVVIDTLGGTTQLRALLSLESGAILVSCACDPDLGFTARPHVRAERVVPEATASLLRTLADRFDGGCP